MLRRQACNAIGQSRGPELVYRPAMLSSIKPPLRFALLLLVNGACGKPSAESAEAGGFEISGDTGSTGSTSGGGTPATSEVPTGTDGPGGSTGGSATTQGTGTSTGDPGTSTGDSGTSTGDSGTSTGGGGVCEDMVAPACTACDAMGEPQRLFGLTWNYAMGAPGSGLGSEELRCIVPETGDSRLIAAIAGMDWLPVGHNAYDRNAAILYAFAYANSDNITRIFSIDTIHGVRLANPPVDPKFNWSGGIYVRSDGALVGVTWNQDVMGEELRVLDTATGATTLIAAIPEIATLYQAIYAYDFEADTIFMVGGKNGDAGEHLFVVDAMNGALIGDPTFAGSQGWPGGIHVRADGQLIGVSGTQLLTIDRESAATGLIAELPKLEGFLFGGSVYDDLSDTLFVVDAQFRLVQIDASTGEVVASPKLATPPNPEANYNWSGGLHIR